MKPVFGGGGDIAGLSGIGTQYRKKQVLQIILTVCLTWYTHYT